MTSAVSSKDHAIEPDPELVGGSESSFADDDDDGASARYTASLTSSIENYPVENGRRYHAYKDGSYVMPNDDSELDRLDLTHNMLKVTMGMKLYTAPLEQTTRSILDIGTGTGLWAIEMADEFPDAEIMGTDLSPTQPTWFALRTLCSYNVLTRPGFLLKSSSRLMMPRRHGRSKTASILYMAAISLQQSRTGQNW